MISESEISEFPKYEVKSKIGNIFVKEKVLEEYSVKIYEIDPYFYEHYKKIRVDQNGREYILFRIDVYFSEYILAVEIDEKKDAGENLFLKALEKNLVVNLLELVQVKKMVQNIKLA